MATADDYKPIEMDPSDPVVKRFMRRIARHKDRVIPAQEPLPPVELKPMAPRPQQPSQPSVGATPPPTYSTNATSIPPSGARGTYPWADVLRMYPPRPAVPLRWTTYHHPIRWKVDHNLTPYASFGATVAKYMSGPTTVTATFRMATAEAVARYGHSATSNDILIQIGQDWGGYGVSISRNVSVGAGMTIDIEVQYHV